MKSNKKIRTYAAMYDQNLACSALTTSSQTHAECCHRVYQTYPDPQHSSVWHVRSYHYKSADAFVMKPVPVFKFSICIRVLLLRISMLEHYVPRIHRAILVITAKQDNMWIVSQLETEQHGKYLCSSTKREVNIS